MGRIALMDIVDRIVAVLEADPTLRDLVAGFYGRPPRLFVGLDDRDRPGPEQCPLILVRPQEFRAGAEEVLEYTVLVDWAVWDEEVAEAADKREYAGVRRLDAMGMRICDALEESLPDALQMVVSELSLETIARFPLMLGGVDLTFRVPAMLSKHLTL